MKFTCFSFILGETNAPFLQPTFPMHARMVRVALAQSPGGNNSLIIILIILIILIIFSLYKSKNTFVLFHDVVLTL